MNNISMPHDLYQKYSGYWKMCRDFYIGESAVKKVGEEYLPKPEGIKTAKEYSNYVLRAYFFGAMSRTVSGLAGIIDRKAPNAQYSDKTAYLANNADGYGMSIRQLSKLCLDECFITGRFGLLVDRDEDGNKPRINLYFAEDIINWSESSKDNYNLVVLREYYDYIDPENPFFPRQQERYRVLYLDEKGHYRQRIISAVDKKGNTEEIDIEITNRGMPIKYIPFTCVNAEHLGGNIKKPPLLDLVYKNAEHYRVGADYANALFFTGNPILYVRGAKRADDQDFNLVIGSSHAIYLPDGDAAIGFAECNGHGVNPNRDRYNDIKEEMAILGARLIEGQKKAAETAETSMIRQSSENSILYGIVLTISYAFQKVLKMVEDWEGGTEAEKILFYLNTDFIDLPINSNTLAVLANMVKQGTLSFDTLFENMRSGELIPLGRTVEEEKALIQEGQSSFVKDATDSGSGAFPDASQTAKLDMDNTKYRQEEKI